MTQPGLQNHGWSAILWFWVILGAVLVVMFFAMAFRKPRLPREADDESYSARGDRLHRHDGEVYP